MADDRNDDDTTGKESRGGEKSSVGLDFEYRLHGPQVEPTASLWLDPPGRICVPTNQDIIGIAERSPSPSGDRIALDLTRDYPGEGNPLRPSRRRLEDQLSLLVELQEARAQDPYPADKPFGPEFEELRDTVLKPSGPQPFRPTPPSRFLQLQPVPFGTVFDVVERRQTKVRNVVEQHARILADTRIINEGQELARAFENETPGLFHRHALNWILFNRVDLSPPRQARIWVALDATIYAALDAAWHYKWLREAKGQDTSRLLRPEEYDGQFKKSRLEILYDRVVGDQGQENGMPRTCPLPTPGTPRHPAWPSGHSTYSAAASHILEFFLSPDTLETPDAQLFDLYPAGSVRITEPGWIAAELRRLANNIGEARMWAGIHWLSDHLAGQRIGRASAEAVIAQLKGDCVPPVDTRRCEEVKDPPPSDKEIADMAGKCTPQQDRIPPREERGKSFLAEHGVT